MSKVKFISVLTESHGRMKDVVFKTRNGRSTMYQYEKHTQDLTANQEKVRKAFVKLVDDWKQLSPLVRKSWDGHGENPNASGYNIFIGDNSPRQMAAEPLRLSRKLGEERLADFKATPGGAAGQISCGFAPVNGDRHLAFFVQEKANGVATGSLERHDGGANCASPFIVTGLNPGMEYFVYALVTDKAYHEAMLVSESVGMLTTAG
ncbi:MAG: hypothetical protein EPN93_03030 [Spirochaetes bacterium]|nr:MAG: hypothetical protein EPN93_03030 [Spirochaetota bacterium]